MGLAIPLKKMLIGRSFSTEKSRIKLFGKMDWTLEPSAGMAQLIQLPAEEVQRRFKKKGEDFLFKFGYDNGKIIVEDIYKSVAGKNEKVTQKIINDLLEFVGLGQLEFIVSRIDGNGHHHIVVHMMNNPIVEHAKSMYKEKSMVCAFFRGMFSAYAENLLKAKNAHLIEKECMCKDPNIDYCNWESRW